MTASKPSYLEQVREELSLGYLPIGHVRDLAGAALRRAQEAQEQGFEAEAMELARFYVDASAWLRSLEAQARKARVA